MLLLWKWCVVYCAVLPMLMIGAADAEPQQSGEESENAEQVEEASIGDTPDATAAASGISREVIGDSVVPSPFSMPSPVAWFRAFEKLGSPRWRQFYRDQGSLTITDRYKAALVLGATLTDAYVAVESRGSQEVRNVLANVRTLEKTLGISDRMQQRHARLGELADTEQWAALRVEIEATMVEQAAVLRQQRDQPLADLLPFGVVLQTIAVNCDIVRELEIEDRLCIGDITLLFSMIRKVEGLSENTLKERSVRDLRRCLKSVRDCWIDSPDNVGSDKVAITRMHVRDFLNGLLENE